MNAEAALITRAFPVGRRYVCTLTVPKPKAGTLVCLVAEWEPHLPKRLTASELADYRRGRDAVLAEVAQRMDTPVVVVE